MLKCRRKACLELQPGEQFAQRRRTAERPFRQACPHAALDAHREFDAAQAVQPQVAFERAVERDTARPRRTRVQFGKKPARQRQRRRGVRLTFHPLRLPFHFIGNRRRNRIAAETGGKRPSLPASGLTQIEATTEALPRLTQRLRAFG